jgi:hypothetical protein
MQYQQTVKYLEPLYDRLKHRSLHEELRAGLWMMVEVSARVCALCTADLNECLDCMPAFLFKMFMVAAHV